MVGSRPPRKCLGTQMRDALLRTLFAFAVAAQRWHRPRLPRPPLLPVSRWRPSSRMDKGSSILAGERGSSVVRHAAMVLMRARSVIGVNAQCPMPNVIMPFTSYRATDLPPETRHGRLSAVKSGRRP
jgi:hypothetical protein